MEEVAFRIAFGKEFHNNHPATDLYRSTVHHEPLNTSDIQYLTNIILFMALRIKMRVNIKLTLERVCRNEWATFRYVSTYLHHAMVVCDLTQIQWIMIRDTNCPPSTPRSDPSANIWVKSQTTNVWSRSEDADWNLAYLFRQTRSKLQSKYIYFQSNILITWDKRHHTEMMSWTYQAVLWWCDTEQCIVLQHLAANCTTPHLDRENAWAVLVNLWRNGHTNLKLNYDTFTFTLIFMSIL